MGIGIYVTWRSIDGTINYSTLGTFTHKRLQTATPSDAPVLSDIFSGYTDAIEVSDSFTINETGWSSSLAIVDSFVIATNLDFEDVVGLPIEESFSARESVHTQIEDVPYIRNVSLRKAHDVKGFIRDVSW